MTPQPPLPPQPAPSTPYYHRSASVLGGRVLYPSSSGGGNRSTPQPDRRSGVGGPPPTTMLSSSLHTDSSTKGRPQHQDTADSPSLSPPSRPLPPAVRGSDPHFIPSQQTSPDEFRGPSFRASLHRPQTSMSTRFVNVAPQGMFLSDSFKIVFVNGGHVVAVLVGGCCICLPECIPCRFSCGSSTHSVCDS